MKLHPTNTQSALGRIKEIVNHLPKRTLIFGGALSLTLLVAVPVIAFSYSKMVSVEPENGTLSGGTTTVSDAGASAGSAVKFNAASGGAVNGMLTSDPNFFPIAVWDQTPESEAANYKNIGINTFAGLYNGVTHSNLTALHDNGLITVADQNSTALSDPLTSTVTAWLQVDEPDNAQSDGNGGYNPCIPVSTLQNTYNSFKSADTMNRPVLLGFGRGVADVNWGGRGSCTGDTQYYRDAKDAADIFAFDIYPVNSGDPLYYVAQGVDNLINWTGGTKPVWADIETTNYSGNQGPTPDQTKYEVWSAIIHGAKGIDYFCHIFSPTFDESGLADDPTMSAAVAAINAQITSLAPVLNIGTTISNSVTSSAGASAPIDTMTKTYNGSTYVIAADMRGTATTATFHPAGITNGTATVLGENRTVTVSGGAFSDTFAGYGIHIYKIN